MHLIPDTTIRRRTKRRRATDVACIRLTMTDKTSWTNLIHQTNLIRFIRCTIPSQLIRSNDSATHIVISHATYIRR